MRKNLTQDQADMKLTNLTAIFNILYDKAPISRAGLAKISGMSPTSITRFVNSMLQANLLHETMSTAKKVGRAATLLTINEEAFYSIGINLDSNFIHVSILDFCKQVVADQYKKINIPSLSLDQALDIAYALYLEEREQTGISADSICGVGVSVAGVMDGAEILAFTPQLKWKGVNLRKAVTDKFKIENVVIENDCNAAIIGQCTIHPEYKTRTVSCICIGSGVGSAVSFNGSLFAVPGKSAFSELGHFVVEPDGMMCDCGNRGCLQTFLAEDALISRAQEYNPSVTLLEEIHSAWVKEIPWARELICQACTYAKVAINNLACAYNPDVVLVGGDSIDLYWDMFEDIISGQQLLFYPFHGRLTIKPFFKSYQSSIIGVSQQVQDRHLELLLQETL